MLYNIAGFLLTDDGQQFPGKVFNSTWVALGTKLMTTNTYQSESNLLTERYNITIINILHGYFGEHQYDLDDNV